MRAINYNKHIWEGWTVGDFIDNLQDEVYIIMSNQSYIEPFNSHEELSKWCTDNQPYYKKVIPEVVSYFADKYNIK